MFVFSPVLIAQAMMLQQLQWINAALTAPQRLQVARASNRNIVTGNIGPVVTGTQNASPLNVGPH